MYRVIDDVFIVKLVYSYTSDIINAGVKDSIPDPAAIECESEDRQARRDPLRNPTNQAMSMQESQRTKVENSWHLRWDPLPSTFSKKIFEDRMRRDAEKDCEQVFNVT